MLPVSDTYKEKINSSSRYMVAEITLIMRDKDDKIIHTLILDDEEISDFDLLEEISSNEELPFGGVSANEFTFTLNNADKRFTPSNTEGPYYGFIGPDVEVRARIGLELEEDVFEYTALGTFYVSEWRAPSQDIVATITAYDKLFDLLEEPVPMLRVVENATVKSLFIDLFLALDFKLADIVIDPQLDITLPFGFTTTGTIQDALQKLSEAGMCTVVMNRQNKVEITSSLSRGTSMASWTDDNQIITIDNPEKFNSIYGALSVAIHEPSLRRASDLVTLSNLKLAKGSVTLERTEFTKHPVVNIDSVSLKNSKGSFIKEFNYGTDNMTILLENPLTTEEIVTLQATGVYCLFTKREMITNIPTVKTKKQLNIDNQLIQTTEHAQKVTDVLTKYMTDPFALFEVGNRGNPALTVGDVIEVDSAIDAVSKATIKVYRTTLNYTGSLEGSIVGRRVI